MFESVASAGKTAQVERSERETTRATRDLVTWGIVGGNALVYVAMVMWGVSPFAPTAQSVLPWGANFGPITLAGQPWRLFTACWVHFGLIHLAFNMYFLIRVGRLTERLYGWLGYLAIYVLAGVGGNVAGLYDHPFTTSAGASGAIFGVYGALLAFLLVRRGAFPEHDTVRLATSAGMFILYNLLYGLKDMTIDMAAHVGGLLTGFAAGCLLARAAADDRRRTRRACLVALGGVLLAAASLRALPSDSKGLGEWSRLAMVGSSVPAANKGRVLYTGGASKEEATLLSRRMESSGVFNSAGVMVLLSKEGGRPSISLTLGGDESAYQPLHLKTSKLVNGKTVVMDSEVAARPFPWNDPKVLASFQIQGIEYAPLVGGVPLDIRLLNKKGEPRRTLTIDTREAPVGVTDAVWYAGEATPESARALGRALQASGYFQDRGGRALLRKTEGRSEISFPVLEGAWDDVRTEPAFTAIGRKAAVAVGGLPVTIHLLDGTLKARKTFVIRQTEPSRMLSK